METKKHKMKSFNVYLNKKLIDTVFDLSTNSEDVKKSLINHDGYNPNIEVKRVK